MIRTQQGWIVRKRDGRTVPFEGAYVRNASVNAFRADQNLADEQSLEDETISEITEISEIVTNEVATQAATDTGVVVEKIQDGVELTLMHRGHYRVARCYIVYRAEHEKIRTLRGEALVSRDEPSIHVVLDDGTHKAANTQSLRTDAT